MSMKKIYYIITALALLSFASCQQDNIVPDRPAEGKLVQLTFGSADAPATRAVWTDETGKGNLIFNWDSDPNSPAMDSGMLQSIGSCPVDIKNSLVLEKYFPPQNP